MAATPNEQARTLRELADRIERGEQVLPEELALRLAAEAKHAGERERVAHAVDEVIDTHKAIITQLSK